MSYFPDRSPGLRSPRRRRLARLVSVAVSALAVALTAPRATAAQPLALTTGRWVEFSYFGGVGPVSEYGLFGSPDGFSTEGLLLSVLAPVTVRLTDAYVAGDVFDLFVNGALRLTTSPVGAIDLGVDTGAGTGEAAALDPRLSRGTLRLGPGDYLLTIAVRETAPGYDFGTGFVRADLSPTSTVPEPATVALVAAGLLAVGAAGARARRHATPNGVRPAGGR